MTARERSMVMPFHAILNCVSTHYHQLWVQSAIFVPTQKKIKKIDFLLFFLFFFSFFFKLFYLQHRHTILTSIPTHILIFFHFQQQIQLIFNQSLSRIHFFQFIIQTLHYI